MVLRPRMVRTLAAFGVAALLASSLAGCGRRGRLLPPPDPNAPAEDAQPASKSGIKRRAPNPPIRPPSDPFILDPLL